MADTTLSSNMSMPVPTVSEAPGPDWATDIDACLSIVDSHNHATGQGVQINPAGIYINADLSMNGNNLTLTNAILFNSLNSALTSLLQSLQVVGVDLYYIDGAGNSVRITQGGSVTGSTGTITGLPSGTASASYSAGTFTFQSATNTPATMAVGPLVMGAATASPHTVTVSSSASLAADYAMVWPLALPGSTSFLNVDNSGNMGFVGTTGSGSVVLNTDPAFLGTPTGTITGNTFSPTVTTNHISGATITITQNSSTWYYTRIGNIVQIQGVVTYTTSGYTSSAGYRWQATIPLSTTTLTVAGSQVEVFNSAAGISQPLINSSNTVMVSTQNTVYNANASGTVTFNYAYQVN